MARSALLMGVFVLRNSVMSLLRELDPQGVSIRRPKKLLLQSRPNDWWHIDGYDKIKRFGFPIIGCIGGFSRKRLWLEIVNSNNDPFVTASAYLNFISELEAILRPIRNDCGTEKSVLAAIQCYFRREHTDEFAVDKAHIHESSHSNQRIETWWSCLRCNWSSFIISFFTEMVESGKYNSDDKLERKWAKFVLRELLRRNLIVSKPNGIRTILENRSSARLMAAPMSSTF